MTTTKRMGLARSKQEFTMGTTVAASHAEKFLGMVAKLHEEVAEVVRAPLDAEEYADVLQVLMDFAQINGIPWNWVTSRRVAKKKRLGGYLPSRLWEKHR